MKSFLAGLARLLAAACLLIAPAAPALAQGGLAPSSSLRSWSAAQPTYLYAGRSLDMSKLALAWSARATAGGLCDVGADDLNGGTSHGPHTWYALDRNYGAGHTNGPGAAISPFSCPGGNLQLRLGYDPANARWYGWELNSAGSNYYGQEGFLARRTGFYLETTITFPASAPAGLCPWVAEVWTNNRLGYPSFPATGMVTEVDGQEHCIAAAPAATPVSTPSSLSTSSVHQFAPNTPQPGLITSQRDKGFGTDVLTRNLFDGQSHRFGLLSTPSWFISYIDRVEVSRVAKSGQEMNQGLWTLKLSNGVYTAPTAAQSATLDLLLTDANVYTCTPSPTSCPAG